MLPGEGMPSRLSEVLAGSRAPPYGAAVQTHTGAVQLPARVLIRDGFLEWSDDDGSGWGERWGPIDHACLRRFVRLAHGSPNPIMAFARHYGTLHLGDSGLPVRLEELPRRVDEADAPRV